MTFRYKYENDEVKKDFKRLRDKIYKSVKRGYISADFYESVMFDISKHEVTEWSIDYANELYKDTLSDQRLKRENMSEDERDMDEEEHEYYTPSQLNAAYDNFYDLINSQPDFVTSEHTNKQYPNLAKQDILQRFNMWEMALGQLNLAKVFLENYDVIEKIGTALEFEYRVTDPQYEELISDIQDFFDSIIFED